MAVGESVTRRHPDAAARHAAGQGGSAMAELFARDTIKSLRKLRLLKPDLFKSFMDFDQAVFKDGALPARTKELMAVTAAHVTQCMWCIEDHTKRAKKQGATDEEIAEAAFVAMALRAGGPFAHACVAMAVTDQVNAAAEERKG
jgi:AhpD family alkylhydroperoxidase